jgi:hypothetical protein
MNQEQVVINGTTCLIDPVLQGFSVSSKPSSNVDFFGTKEEKNQFFAQFKNGGAFIWSGVPQEKLLEASETESIGKFVTSQIRGKFESESHSRLVTPLADDEDFFEDDDDDMFADMEV